MFLEKPFIVIDDFLSKTYFEMLKKEVFSTRFTWTYRENITYKDDSKVFVDWDNYFNSNSNSEFGFSHEIYYDGESLSHLNLFLSSFFASLLDVSKAKKILRSRVDMVTYSPEKYKHFPHVDFYFPHISSVFYLTDSDAETVIYDLKCDSYHDILGIDVKGLKEIAKIKPKENRILFFDGSYLHTGHSPSQFKKRVLINTNLLN